MDTRPNDTSNEEHGERFFVSPEDFYEEVSKRPDIKKILAELARR